jgi:hypothetical protein
MECLVEKTIRKRRVTISIAVNKILHAIEENIYGVSSCLFKPGVYNNMHAIGFIRQIAGAGSC